LTTEGRGPKRQVPRQGKRGLILLDELRTLDKVRLVKRLGNISPAVLASTLKTLQQVFA
jgi:mRNA interferase MazF